MSATYRNLVHHSSDLLGMADAQEALGRRPEARLLRRVAGWMRRRMGVLCYLGGRGQDAAHDWLDAAVCFVQGGDREAARSVLRRVRLVDRRGYLVGREDLRARLRAAEAEAQANS